jgi:23S rRNA pseudouridine2605 synthase
MLGALDIEVLRLVRLAIGSLQLGNLEKGRYRALTADEKRAVDDAMKVNSGIRRPKLQHRSPLL